MSANTAPPSESLGRCLIQLGQRAMTWAEMSLGELGMKSRQPHALATIAAHPTMSQREISFQLGVDPNVMVDVIDNLKLEGLAVRRRSETDRRRHILVVTPKAEQTLIQSTEMIAAGEDEFFAVLNAQQRQTLLELCNKLLHSNNEEK